MWQLDQFLSMIAVLVVIPIFAFIRFFQKPMAERSYQHQKLESEMTAQAEQTLTALPIVQVFNREEYEEKRFRSLTQRASKAYFLNRILEEI